MPCQQLITSVPGVKIDRISDGNIIIFHGRLDLSRRPSCPGCQAQEFRIKSTRTRRLNYAMQSGRLIVLRVLVPKLLCKRCGCYFTPPIPGVLPKRRSSEQFRQEVFTLHHGGITQLQLGQMYSISGSTVERWYRDFVVYRVKELEGRSAPRILGIDEHFFTRKKGYATTLVDLRNHKVFDVVLGRSELSLKNYLERLPGRDQVEIVVMDLSETYRAIVKKYFPRARIVADRFHVIRMLNHHFLKLWQTLDPQGRKNRGLLSLMRRHAWRLNPEQIPKLEKYFEQIPGLKPLYDFKQDLAQLLLKKRLRKNEAKQLIPQLLWHVHECIQSPWEGLQTLGKTLQSWIEPIVRMWRFSKSNGITEGFHNKMEMISRRAYGFRNFENYRLRVIALCGWNGVFALRN